MKSNLGLKIVALLMAVFFWLQVTLVSRHESQTSLPLKLVNAAGADSLRRPARKISSQVEGRGLDILRLKYSKAFIQMEAADYWAGNSSNYLAEDVPEKLNVKVLGVMPPTLAEQLKEKDLAKTGEVPADVQADISAAGSPAAEPAKPVHKLGEQPQTRILTDLRIVPPPGISIFPARASLKLRGKASLLAGLPSGVRVYTANQPDARGQYSVKADVPEGITVQDITPKQVRGSK